MAVLSVLWFRDSGNHTGQERGWSFLELLWLEGTVSGEVDLASSPETLSAQGFPGGVW